MHSSEGINVIHESEPCVTSERTKSEIQIKLSAGGCWRQSVLKKSALHVLVKFLSCHQRLKSQSRTARTPSIDIRSDSFILRQRMEKSYAILENSSKIGAYQQVRQCLFLFFFFNACVKRTLRLKATCFPGLFL